MKRFFVAVSILCLLTASMAGYAKYCVFSFKDCASKVASESSCHHEMESTSGVRCGDGGGDIECQSRPACGRFAAAEDDKECTQEQDCEPKICLLLPPLVADGPNRATSLGPDNPQSSTFTLEINLVEASYTKTPDSPPPWGIHPCIAMSVLRI